MRGGSSLLLALAVAGPARADGPRIWVEDGNVVRTDGLPAISADGRHIVQLAFHGSEEEGYATTLVTTEVGSERVVARRMLVAPRGKLAADRVAEVNRGLAGWRELPVVVSGAFDDPRPQILVAGDLTVVYDGDLTVWRDGARVGARARAGEAPHARDCDNGPFVSEVRASADDAVVRVEIDFHTSPHDCRFPERRVASWALGRPAPAAPAAVGPVQLRREGATIAATGLPAISADGRVVAYLEDTLLVAKDARRDETVRLYALRTKGDADDAETDRRIARANAWLSRTSWQPGAVLLAKVEPPPARGRQLLAAGELGVAYDAPALTVQRAQRTLLQARVPGWSTRGADACAPFPYIAGVVAFPTGALLLDVPLRRPASCPDMGDAPVRAHHTIVLPR